MAVRLARARLGTHYTPIEQEETIQSVLFFKDDNIANGKRYYQTFPMDAFTLKYHVITGHVKLHIDRNNSNNYFFEIIRDK